MAWHKSALTQKASPRRTGCSGRPLRIELLEGRCLPATITPITFDDGGPGSGSLRDAVLQFNADVGTDEDIIQLQAGTYTLTIQNMSGHHETAGLTGDLNINSTSHRWIIQGAGSSGDNPTVIDAGQLQDRVFQIVNPGTQVVFQDLVVQGGQAQDDGSDGALPGTTDPLGGGILNNGGNITLDNVVVQNNVARGGDAAVLSAPGHNASGGGISSTGGAFTIAGATIANNQAIGGRGGDHNGLARAGNGGSATGAGLYAIGGSLDISDSMIAGNRATGGRGGDGFITGTGSGSHTVVGGGTGGMGQGGGLYVNGSSFTVTTSAIASNQGTGGSGGLFGDDGYGQGGGLYNGSTLTVSNSTLSANTAYSGGGIYNGSTLTVSNSTLSANTAYSGAGIYNGGTLTVTNTTLFGNTASSSGGGIDNNSGTLTVTDSTLSGNTANSGGAIFNLAAALTVNNSTLSGNTASGPLASGGGIYNSGTLTVTNTTLSGNSAAYHGGAIANSGTLTVSNSTVSGNTAAGYYIAGGGIYNSGTLTITNTTLSGNSASYGGGIFDESGPVTLTNVTLTANWTLNGGGGGGFHVSSGSPVLHNTLIAGNFRGSTGTTRDDVYGTLDPSGDYNLIGDGTGMTGLSNGVNGNLVGSHNAPIDPLLGPLTDNGGPTFTHALLSGSPAIDAGNNDYATDWDQRGDGFPRIVNGIIDIGAFEVQEGGRGPGWLVPSQAQLLRLDVAPLLGVMPAQLVSRNTGQTQPGDSPVDALFSSSSLDQRGMAVRRAAVMNDLTPFHMREGSRRDSTEADAFDPFAVFLADWPS
jgi:hypothetical protein